MNETIKSILERRTTRDFTQEQIPDDALELIVECARYAPSGMNAQTCHFTVIQNAEILKELNEKTKLELRNTGVSRLVAMGEIADFNFFYNAPTLIIISADPKKAATPVEDAAFCMQNIMIAAQSLGIDSACVNSICFVHNKTEVRYLLSDIEVPSKNHVYGCIALGYSNCGKPEAPDRTGFEFNYVR